MTTADIAAAAKAAATPRSSSLSIVEAPLSSDSFGQETITTPTRPTATALQR
jgi:hypothetical protein